MANIPFSQKILGAVLAGGRSTRFGTDKGLALLDGKPLLAHAVEGLARHAGAVIVCGREWSDGVAIPDKPVADLGPLGGLNAALDYARHSGFGWVLTAGCDTPELPDHLLEQLAIRSGPAILETMPIIGIWPSNLADILNSYLERNDDRSIKRWARTAGARIITADDPIPNINTPAELEAISVALSRRRS